MNGNDTSSTATDRTRQSVWMETSIPRHAPLEGDLQVDVCVVGAGISGLTTAYLLGRGGKTVALLDDGPIAGGQTQRTTAHLANALDDRYYEIERLHGPEGSRLAAESHTAAIDRIAAIVGAEAIDCDFTRLDGYLFLPPDDGPRETLDRELAAAHRAGLADVELVPRAPLGSFDTGPCLRFPRQGQFHPLKYLAGLSRCIERDGGRIFTGSHATSIEGGTSARVTTDRGAVTAGAVVVATNTPVNDRVAIHTKQAAYLSYVVAAPVPRGMVTRALFWDTMDPYHYVRTQPLGRAASGGEAAEHELLLVGGEDHKTGQATDQEERFARLEAWARERFPMFGEIRHRWSGQVMETIDGLAFIGPNPGDAPNVFIATGDSGMGITHGTIAGILLTDLILGRENPWAALYDPSRKTLGAAATFAGENLNVARQYGDWLTAGDVASADAIAPGSGAVVRRGLRKLAIYRDPQGGLHELSAVCPHLGCVVAWNDSEASWDCPCHGSRFDRFGKVTNGPANRDLAPAEP